MSDELNGQTGEVQPDTPTTADAGATSSIAPDTAADSGAGTSPVEATPTAGSHNYDLQPLGRLVGGDGDGAGELQAYAGAMHSANAPQEVLAGIAAAWERGTARGAISPEELAAAANDNPAHLGAAADFYIERAISDTSPPTSSEVSDARTLVRTLPPAFIDWLETPRANGTVPGNDPRVIRFFAYSAAGAMPRRSLAPTAAQPKAGPAAGGSVNAEIASIESVMRTDRKRYNGDAAMQTRLRELYSQRGR